MTRISLNTGLAVLIIGTFWICNAAFCAAVCEKSTDTTPPAPCVHDESMVTRCLECHEGAEKDHAHQVEVRPDRFPPPKTWPMVNNAVSCVTCHDIVGKTDMSLYETSPLFYREGPYASMVDFCFRCHEPLKQDLHKLNPHVDMLTKAHDINYKNCTNCHSVQVRSPKTKVTRKDIKLPDSLICVSCHEKTQHVGSDVHIEKKLTSRMLSHLKTYEKTHQITVPLMADDRVSCLSCHLVHPQKVLDSFQVKTVDVTPKKVTPSPSLVQELRSFRRDLIDQKISGKKYTLYDNTQAILSLRIPCTACHAY